MENNDMVNKNIKFKKLNYSLFEYQMPETEFLGGSSSEKGKLRDYFVLVVLILVLVEDIIIILSMKN